MSDALEQDGSEHVRHQLRPSDIVDILTTFKRLRLAGSTPQQAYREIGEAYGRNYLTIRTIIRRFQPSSGVAADYVKANALKLAMRVVRKANVTEAIDILSRPNVGVLEPIKQASGTGGGFVISIAADSCGAKVGIAQGTGVPHAIGAGSPLSLQAGDQDAAGVQGEPSHRSEEHDIWSDPHPEGVPDRPREDERAEDLRLFDPDDQPPQTRPVVGSGRGQGMGHSKAFQEAQEAARKRLALRRRGIEHRRVKAAAKRLREELQYGKAYDSTAERSPSE